LTALFNLSVCHANIPVVWKSTIVIPLLKPGKLSELSSSYHPISLLSLVVKLLERLLHPAVTAALPKHESQHGYDTMHLTVMALLQISKAVAIGFNGTKPALPSAVVAIDISKAFNSVDHTLLIEEISGSDLHSNFVRWLSAYLRGRTVRCSYNGALSPPRNIHSGVLQGSVLSPALFNFFVSDCPALAGVHVSYADDIYLLESDANIDVLSEKLNASIQAVSDWAKRKGLVLPPEKTQVTLFTPHNFEFDTHPQVFIDGVLIPLNKTPIYLPGIKHDTKFS
jgi:hypothetical protein